MAQTTKQPLPPYVDDVTVKESFADGCAGISFSNGNLHLTFVTLSANHSANPAQTKKVVSARVVVSVPGAIELTDMLSQFLNALRKSGVISTTPIIPPIVTGPSGKPN